MNYEIKTSVVDGNLKRNRNLIKDAIASFEGKEIIIKIEKAKKKRSTPQNNYYWGVVIPLIQLGLKETGNPMTAEKAHELLRLKFLKKQIHVNEETGEILEYIQSTTELTTSQFMDFMVETQHFSLEYFNIIIPDPNEDLTLNFND